MKYHWYINCIGDVIRAVFEPEYLTRDLVAIGNYFETPEEAKKAIEKLEALKRLKDKGFRFDGWTIDDGCRISICTNTDGDGIYDDDKKEMKKDLDLVFGGEE